MIQAIVPGDREAFYAREIAARREAGLPPFGRLAGADRLRLRACRDTSLSPPPSAAPRRSTRRSACLVPPKRRWRCRARPPPLRLLVQAPRNADLQAYLRAWLAAAPKPRADLRCRSTSTRRSFSLKQADAARPRASAILPCTRAYAKRTRNNAGVGWSRGSIRLKNQSVQGLMTMGRTSPDEAHRVEG